MIRRKRADTFVYRLYCDKCQSEMTATGGALTSNPVMYTHACNNDKCDHIETIRGKRYPLVDTVEIQEEVAE
jgi:hypothetical protein